MIQNSNLLQMESLTPTQRALLTTDGSFTLLLEAITGEKIVADPIESKNMMGESRDPRIPMLEANGGDKLLFRSALLKTASQKTVAYVESITVLSRTSKKIQEELVNETPVPIGKMLREERLETFREIVETKFVADAVTQKYLGTGEKPARTYVIFANKLPIMAISEYLNIR